MHHIHITTYVWMLLERLIWVQLISNRTLNCCWVCLRKKIHWNVSSTHQVCFYILTSYVTSVYTVLACHKTYPSLFRIGGQIWGQAYLNVESVKGMLLVLVLVLVQSITLTSWPVVYTDNTKIFQTFKYLI